MTNLTEHERICKTIDVLEQEIFRLEDRKQKARRNGDNFESLSAISEAAGLQYAISLLRYNDFLLSEAERHGV